MIEPEIEEMKECVFGFLAKLQYRKALEYFEETVKVIKIISCPTFYQEFFESVRQIFTEKVKFLIENSEISQALELEELLSECYTRLGITYWEIKCQIDYQLAKCYFLTNNRIEAYSILKKLIKIDQIQDEVYEITPHIYLLLSKLYLTSGKNNKKAKKFAYEAFKRAESLYKTEKSTENGNILLKALFAKASLSKESGEYQQAINSINQAISLTETLQNPKFKKKFESLSTHLSEAQSEISLQNFSSPKDSFSHYMARSLTSNTSLIKHSNSLHEEEKRTSLSKNSSMQNEDYLGGLVGSILLIQKEMRIYLAKKQFNDRQLEFKYQSQYLAKGIKEIRGKKYFLSITKEKSEEFDYWRTRNKRGSVLSIALVTVEALPLELGVKKPESFILPASEICFILGVVRIEELVGIEHPILLDIVDVVDEAVVLKRPKSPSKIMKRLLFKSSSLIEGGGKGVWVVKVFEVSVDDENEFEITAEENKSKFLLKVKKDVVYRILRLRPRDPIMIHFRTLLKCLLFHGNVLVLNDNSY